MSLYQFFASDKEMPEMDNGHIVATYSGKEINAIRFLTRASEETAMRIFAEDDFYYASQYTDKKYVNYIEWYYNEENAKIIIDYIKMLLLDRYTVSLFNVWQGDNSPLKTRKVNIEELTIYDIKKIWGQKFFESNECLVVYKTFYVHS